MNNIKNVILLIAFLVPCIVSATFDHFDPELTRTSPRRSLYERIAPILTRLTSGTPSIPTPPAPHAIMLVPPTAAMPIQAIVTNFNFTRRSRGAQSS